jgi:Protein of unknown function (DUF2829).
MNFTHIANPVAVTARAILGVSTITEGAMLALDDTTNYFANNAMLARYTPVAGDYLVTQDDGYQYVNPKDVFERKYHPVDDLPEALPAPTHGVAMCFSGALLHLKGGAKIARAGWNGKGMFVYMVPANSYPAQTGVAKDHFGDGAMVPYKAYMALKGTDDTVSTWAPSAGDTLAEDWEIVL